MIIAYFIVMRCIHEKLDEQVKELRKGTGDD
jgi:hypothetical protein